MTVNSILSEATIYNETNKEERRKRKKVFGGKVVDIITKFPQHDFDTVLNGWKQIRKNLKKTGVRIFHNLLTENPQYKAVFPNLQDVNVLEDDEFFVIHSHAVMRGINSVIKNLSGEYEEENEILPAISLTHQKRNVAREMMVQLKDTLIYTCSDVLLLNRKEITAWRVIFDYIFENYICKYLPEEEQEEEGGFFGE